MIRIVNIIPQLFEHTDAKIVGNREGIELLIQTLQQALKDGKASTSFGGSHINPDGKIIGVGEGIFASDGEGYDIKVEIHDDDWNDYENPEMFWNKKENYPYYTCNVYDESRQEIQDRLGIDYFGGELTIKGKDNK
jgi:hypothetical protein